MTVLSVVTVLSVLAVVTVGVMVGVELAVAVFVNPIFDRLPGDGGVAARSDGARVLGRVMPFWYVSSVVLAAAWAVLGWGAQATATVVVAGGLLLVGVLMSVLLLVPINDRVARWQEAGAPVDWRDQLRAWDRWHYLRVAVIVAAFALLVVAAATR